MSNEARDHMRTLLYLSRNLYCQVSNRHPSIYWFLEHSSPRTFLFHTPCLLNFRKCSSQDILTVTKKDFNIFPNIFRHKSSFVGICSNCIAVSNWVIINVTVICCIKTNNKVELKLLNLYDNIIFFYFYSCVITMHESKN